MKSNAVKYEKFIDSQTQKMYSRWIRDLPEIMKVLAEAIQLMKTRIPEEKRNKFENIFLKDIREQYKVLQCVCRSEEVSYDSYTVSMETLKEILVKLGGWSLSTSVRILLK